MHDVVTSMYFEAGKKIYCYGISQLGLYSSVSIDSFVVFKRICTQKSLCYFMSCCILPDVLICVSAYANK